MPQVTTRLRRRTSVRAAAALLAGTAVLLAAAPAEATAQDQCPGASAVPSVNTLREAADAVSCLVNANRARNGLRALQADGDLRQAARRHSRNMVRRGFFSHVTPRGASLGDRLRRSGYLRANHARHAAEALAWGGGTSATPAAIVAEWIASPSHRHILLGRDFREVGVGVAAGAPQPTTGGRRSATYTLNTGAVGG